VKPILEWIKSNLLVVIFSAVTVLALPLSFFFSSSERQKGLEARQKEADAAYTSAAKLDVTYTLPSFDPGSKPVEVKSAPNSKLTDWFKAQRTKLLEANSSVVKRAEDFNQGIGADAAAVGRSEFHPFVDGLFPSAEIIATREMAAEKGKAIVDAMPAEQKAEELKKMSEQELIAAKGKEAMDAVPAEQKEALTKALASKAQEIEQPKLNDMEDALLGKRGRPNPYDTLLAVSKAGGPADPIKVADALRDMAARETEKITAGKRPLTDEEQKALSKQLAERRLAEYQAAAKGLTFYATKESFPSDRSSRSIPRNKIDPDDINRISLFLHQWDYWALQDIFAAAKLANTVDGKATDIERSVVKRLESISMTDPKGLFKSADESAAVTPDGSAAPAAAPAAPGMVPVDPTVSITGREMSPANTMYDIRRVTVVAVVSSARINEFLDAISKTNFMSVTDMDLAKVDVWQDLKDGYYYGNENVVRATLQIETVWFRSWMSKYMPPEILGVLGGGEAAGAGAGNAAAAPAAAPAPSGGKGRGRAPGRG